MPHHYHRQNLWQALRGLAKAGVIPGAAARLEDTRMATGRALREAILAEIPAFSGSGNPDVLPGLERHGGEHQTELLRLFSGGELDNLDFVAAHAKLRAEQRFPLEATLHAYRCGHRVLSQWLRQAAIAAAPVNPGQVISAVADFSVEYTNAISTVATAAYVNSVRLMAEAESDQRSELLALLLNGYDESDGRVAQVLKQAGYLDQRQSYCVAAVQPVKPSELQHPARAQRIANAIAQAFAGTPIRAIAGLRGNTVVAIFSDRRRQSGWTAPQSALAGRIAPLLQGLGPAVLTGLSADHPSTAYIPKAVQEATVALGLASVERRVVEFMALPIRDLLVHHGAGSIQSVAPAWAQALAAADGGASGVLLETLRAIANADMNVQEAGRRLGRHPNTIYARMQRIREVTGKDPARYHDLSELLLAADCWKQ